MPDQTPNTHHVSDGDDWMDTEFVFPGTERDDLTEEERSFSFDEDYMAGDLPAAPRKEEADESGLDDRVEALASAFRVKQKEENRMRQERAEKVDAVFDAFKKRSTQPAPEPEREEEVFAAFTELARAERQSAVQPKETARVPAKQAARRTRRIKVRRTPDPVTIGRTLRGDQMLVYDSELDEVDYTDEEDLPEARDYMPIRFRRYGRLGISGGVMYALFVISVSILLACFAWLCASDVLALNKEPKSAIVTINEYAPEGDDPITVTIDEKEVPIQVDIDQVAAALSDAGMIEYKWLFKLFSHFSHAETKIDPGTYDVSTELDYRALVTALQFGSGNQEITRVTFPEGYNMEQIFTLLEENHICHKNELYDAAANYDFDYDFLDDSTLGDAERLQGYLFPDTYDFYEGEDAAVAINRFLRNMNGKLSDDIRDAAARKGLSIRELVTIASYIEKEAGSDDERPIMASIIYNRLNSGMKLQLDSTLNYIKGTSTLALTYDDMEIDSPYNTYMYTGLTPGPICNPGLASIQAAAEPESTDYWYWYSVDGVTTFFTNSSDFEAFASAHPVNND